MIIYFISKTEFSIKISYNYLLYFFFSILHLQDRIF